MRSEALIWDTVQESLFEEIVHYGARDRYALLGAVGRKLTYEEACWVTDQEFELDDLMSEVVIDAYTCAGIAMPDGVGTTEALEMLPEDATFFES